MSWGFSCFTFAGFCQHDTAYPAWAVCGDGIRCHRETGDRGDEKRRRAGLLVCYSEWPGGNHPLGWIRRVPPNGRQVKIRLAPSYNLGMYHTCQVAINLSSLQSVMNSHICLIESNFHYCNREENIHIKCVICLI